jgi:hypothetical protein
MKILLLSLALLAPAVLPAYSQVKQDANDVGHDVKNGAKDGAHDVKKGATKSTHAAKKGVHKTATKVSDKTKSTTSN